MKKLLSLALIAIVAGSSLVRGQGSVTGSFNKSATGTTSATVFVDSNGYGSFANITDMSWRLDAGVNTGVVVFRYGNVPYSVTSATSASTSVVYFGNSPTAVSAGEYIIVYVSATGTYYLRSTSASTSTSVTCNATLPEALTTNDKIWSVASSMDRAIPNTNSSTSSLNIWLPAGVPTAITVDGNTTACRISVSGVRSAYK
jgi:hypothetical protein